MDSFIEFTWLPPLPLLRNALPRKGRGSNNCAYSLGDPLGADGSHVVTPVPSVLS